MNHRLGISCPLTIENLTTCPISDLFRSVWINNYFIHSFLMNTTLKSSTLVPLINKPDNQVQHPLTLIKSSNKLDQPNQQQKKAIAQIYVEQARLYFQERNWRNAIAACNKALQLDAHHADAYRLLGNILSIKGKKTAALGVYAKALELNPNSAPIYANLGSFHAEQQEWQQALEYYQQAVIIDPHLAGAYRSLARVWEELGDREQALEYLCQAVNLEPSKFSAEEYFSFGDRLYQEGKLPEASIFYTHGVELEPHAETALTRLVEISERLEQWQQAVIFYHKLMSLSDSESPENSTVTDKPIKDLLSKSRARLLSEKQAKPVSPTSKAIAPTPNSNLPQLLPPGHAPEEKVLPSLPESKEPHSAVSWNNLGSSYAKKQQWLKAISCYQEAIQLDPKLGKTYRNLARVYLKIGKKTQAALSWYQAFDLEPYLIKAEEHYSLAQQLVNLNQLDEAIACLQHAIKQNPDLEPAYLLMGKLLERQGKTDEAQVYYQKLPASV